MQYSIINLKDVLKAKRFDSEFFKPEFINNELLLKRNNFGFFKDIIDIQFGTTPKGAKFLKKGMPFIRSQNFSNGFIENNEIVYISKKEHLKQIKSKIENKDILVASVGATIGQIGYYINEKDGNINQNIARLRVKNKEINPEFLFIFLKSKFGQYQLGKTNTGNAQSYLNTQNISSFIIPFLDKNFQSKIEKIVKSAYQKQLKSKELYQEAEEILLKELNLLDYKPKHILFFEARKKEIDEAKRFDAEYFQPKYFEIINKVEKYKGGFEELKNLTTYINHGNQPSYTKKGEIRFFSQKWIKDRGIDYSFLESDKEPMVSKKFFDDDKNKSSLVNKGDILYYSVGANLGFCHNYLEEEPIAVGSFINIIRADEKKINKLFLGFVLNSIIGRMQGDREKSGIAQPYIYAKNLRKIKIPLINSKIQKQISDKIKESYNLREESKELLEKSKKAVEIYIEKDENEAIQFLNV